MLRLSATRFQQSRQKSEQPESSRSSWRKPTRSLVDKKQMRQDNFSHRYCAHLKGTKRVQAERNAVRLPKHWLMGLHSKDPVPRPRSMMPIEFALSRSDKVRSRVGACTAVMPDGGYSRCSYRDIVVFSHLRKRLDLSFDRQQLSFYRYSQERNEHREHLQSSGLPL